MKTAQVGPSDWLWKKETGYYAGSAEALMLRPVLPDIASLRDRTHHRPYHQRYSQRHRRNRFCCAEFHGRLHFAPKVRGPRSNSDGLHLTGIRAAPKV